MSSVQKPKETRPRCDVVMWIVLLFNRVIIYQLVIYYHVDYEELNMRTCVSFTSLDVLFIFLIIYLQIMYSIEMCSIGRLEPSRAELMFQLISQSKPGFPPVISGPAHENEQNPHHQGPYEPTCNKNPKKPKLMCASTINSLPHLLETPPLPKTLATTRVSLSLLPPYTAAAAPAAAAATPPMGKASKKSVAVAVAPAAVPAKGKGGKKREAEDEIEKAVSAKKQKAAAAPPAKAVPAPKADAKKAKKQPPPKKAASSSSGSSSEEDSSESEEEVVSLGRSMFC